eukprot:245981-Rhodomonas_salina.1
MKHRHRGCDCPLSSEYCIVQIEKREQWFDAIEGGHVEDMMEAIASISGSPASRELLVVRDPGSRTALHLAAALQHEELVKALIEIIMERKDHSNILNLPDPVEGMNPLLEACRAGNLPIVVALCEAGAKWYVVSNENKMCRDYAEEGGFKEIIDYFERHGADHEEEEDESGAHELGFADETAAPTGEANEDAALDENEDNQGVEASVPSTPKGDEEPDSATGGQEVQVGDSQGVEEEEEGTALSREQVDTCTQKAADASFFTILDVPDLLDIFQHCRLHHVPENSYIVRPVTCDPYMMFVLSGSVHVTMKQLQEGIKTQQTDFELQEGDTYGETILLLGDQMATKFSSVEGCTLVELTSRHMKEFLQTHRKLVPELGEFLALHVSMRSGKPGGMEDHMLAMEMAQRIEARYEPHAHPQHPAAATAPDVAGDQRPRRARTIPEVPFAHYKVKQGVNAIHVQARGLERARPPTTASAGPGAFERVSSVAKEERLEQEYGDRCAELGVEPKLAVVLQLRETLMGLHDHSFAPRDATALGHALARNRSVRHLNLARNNIGDDGCRGLVEALAGGGRLETLRLEGNRLGRGSAGVLGEL